MHAAGGHRDRVAGQRHDRAQPDAELHRAFEHVEALLLLRVHVRAGNAAVGGELELELEQLAVGVGGGAQEFDALAGDGVLDDLSCMGHGSSVRRDGRFDIGRGDEPGSPAAAISGSFAGWSRGGGSYPGRSPTRAAGRA